MQQPSSVSFPLSRLFGDLWTLWSKVCLVPSKPVWWADCQNTTSRMDWLTSRHDMSSSPATSRWSKVTQRSDSAKKICDMQWNSQFYRIHPKSLRFHTRLSLEAHQADGLLDMPCLTDRPTNSIRLQTDRQTKPPRRSCRSIDLTGLRNQLRKVKVKKK